MELVQCPLLTFLKEQMMHRNEMHHKHLMPQTYLDHMYEIHVIKPHLKCILCKDDNYFISRRDDINDSPKECCINKCISRICNNEISESE